MALVRLDPDGEWVTVLARLTIHDPWIVVESVRGWEEAEAFAVELEIDHDRRREYIAHGS